MPISIEIKGKKEKEWQNATFRYLSSSVALICHSLFHQIYITLVLKRSIVQLAVKVLFTKKKKRKKEKINEDERIMVWVNQKKEKKNVLLDCPYLTLARIRFPK